MRQRVFFEVDGTPVVGDLYLPAATGPHPAVVVAGPMTSVKEQVTGTYACALAMRGFAALAIDHRHYGESGGAPRSYECWHHKVADLKAAVDWLATHPEVDAAKLGLVGVCLGAGYAAWAAVDNPRVRALGAVAGYYRDPSELREKDAAGFAEKVDAGRAAREHFEATGEVRTIPAVGLVGDAAMTLPDTYDYYATRRAAVPNYRNELALMSREHFLPFDVQAAAPRVAVPMAMVHAEKALSPAWARRFYERVDAPKSILWVDSENQVDFYDDPRLVRAACDEIALHLRAHLVGAVE
ncbi:MAG: alpha/beta hydrolase [Polyangiaceae bacterium]|nr:alpha/beta hydrolase [Polyangiaceae bacterium]